MTPLEYFGAEHQKKKAIEELSELIEAIRWGDRDEILEEIADSLIMIEQLKTIYSIDNNELGKKTHEKVSRIHDRIESGYYEEEKKKFASIKLEDF